MNLFFRSETRRNSYSSDSVSRKYRNGGRKKQAVQRKGESPKINKPTKGRVVQVNTIIINSIQNIF
jgi:hypothetical protein